MPIKGFAKSAASSQQRKVTTENVAGLGGLVEEEHPLGRKSTDLVEARNVARKGFMLGTRPTLEQDDGDYDAAISGTPAIQGIYEYRYSKATSRQLLTAAGGSIYATDNTALSETGSPAITAGADYRWSFTTFADKVYAVGGKPTATVDDMWVRSGTGNVTKIDMTAFSGAITAGAQFIFSKWNFIFLGGLNGTTYYDNPMAGRYANWGTDPATGTNWPASNVIPGVTLGQNFGPGSYGAEYNTGWGSFTDNKGDFLLFLTNRRIVPFEPNLALSGNEDAFSQSDAIDIGCVSQHAFVNLGQDIGDAVYMSDNGIHSLAMSKDHGNRVEEYLSWPIRQTFAGLNKSRLKYTTSAYWPDEGIILFLVATGSSTTQNKILCLDIRGAKQITPDECRWYTWDFDSSITPNVIAAARGSDDKPYIYLGDTAGRVMRFSRDTYADMGARVTVAIQTANEDYGLLTKTKVVGDTYVLMQGQGTYSVLHNYVFDDGTRTGPFHRLTVPTSGAVWDTGVWDTDTWAGTVDTQRQRIFGTGSSPTIAHRFTHNGLGEPFWIGSLTQEAFVSGPSPDAEANQTV
jgi:hypothetical protein